MKNEEIAERISQEDRQAKEENDPVRDGRDDCERRSNWQKRRDASR